MTCRRAIQRTPVAILFACAAWAALAWRLDVSFRMPGGIVRGVHMKHSPSPPHSPSSSHSPSPPHSPLASSLVP